MVYSGQWSFTVHMSYTWIIWFIGLLIHNYNIWTWMRNNVVMNRCSVLITALHSHYHLHVWLAYAIAKGQWKDGFLSSYLSVYSVILYIYAIFYACKASSTLVISNCSLHNVSASCMTHHIFLIVTNEFWLGLVCMHADRSVLHCNYCALYACIYPVHV